MIFKKLIIFTLIYLFIRLLLINEYFDNSKKNTIYDLKYTKLKIKNNILTMINKNDKSVYTSYNIKTFNSTILYFKTTIKYILKEKNRKNILMLGFGLGGIPLKLSLDDNIKRIDCVDIDEELFIYFKKIFPHYSKKIKLHLTDANSYLKNTKTKYDIVIDDVFKGYNKIELDYKNLTKCLNKNGKLYVNNFDINKRNIQIVKKLKKLFRISENKIIPNLTSQSVYIFKHKIIFPEIKS